MATTLDPVVFYHANCLDGFTAAWCAWRAMGEDALYYPLDYKDPLPAEGALANRQIYMLDMCLTEEKMTFLANASGHDVVCLDHHKGMQETWSQLYKNGIVAGKFSLSNSGAGLAWDYFNSHVGAPSIVDYIQDRDLWRFNLPHSKAIVAYVASHEFDMHVWEELHNELETSNGRMAAIGAGNAILRANNKIIKSVIATGTHWKWIGGYLVPCVNVNYAFASEVGHELSLPKHISFSATYQDEAEGRRYSLRSNKEHGIDVSAIAKLYGGGGHVNASGFFVKRERLAELEEEFQNVPSAGGLGPK